MLSPGNGCSPVAIQYRTTPSEKMSARPSIGAPVNCSGGMNAGVPRICPVSVVWPAASLATPKSVILGRSMPCVSLRSQQDIRGFDVAVNDSVLVRVSQRFGDLLANFADAVERQPLAFFYGVGQRLAADELHHQKGQAFVLAHVEDRNNSRMRQRSRRARFPVKPLAKIVSLLAGQHQRNDRLQRDHAIHGRVFRAVHGSHRAMAQLFQDFVSADFFWRVHCQEFYTLARTVPCEAGNANLRLAVCRMPIGRLAPGDLNIIPIRSTARLGTDSAACEAAR